MSLFVSICYSIPLFTCRPHEFKLLRDNLSDRKNFSWVRRNSKSMHSLVFRSYLSRVHVLLFVHRVAQTYAEYLSETMNFIKGYRQTGGAYQVSFRL